MFLCAMEEELDHLDNFPPLDRQPPADMIELLGPLLAAALGLEAEPNLEADVAVPGEPNEGEGFREVGSKLPPVRD